ncbi:PREDICTED: putative methyl-CpG-binding domain protein 3-like 3-like [Chrysochloris asiatica]|uniref:Methyl-CpG-binding domain protein 3-like 3-like n=1 Tax=Chrysochloris asiatica TaxID=185453 RepID=A0A9B0TB50_CHRAS|nr:PREDICTED: putative methyl-CpG-binding domain protein 3-like 3-like [Chrysochloris asiatica]
MDERASTCSPRQTFLGKLKRNMMVQTSKRKRKHETEARRKFGASSKIPIRLTSCIFQRPVSRIISHPGNGVRCNQWEAKLKKCQQVCAYRRLQGLQACSTTGELFSTLDFLDASQIIAPGGPVNDVGPLTYTEPTPVQYSNVAEIIPGVGMCLSHILSGQLVTPVDIRRQTQKVKKARERLALALRADRLAREAERARSQEGRPEN